MKSYIKITGTGDVTFCLAGSEWIEITRAFRTHRKIPFCLAGSELVEMYMATKKKGIIRFCLAGSEWIEMEPQYYSYVCG